VARCRTLALLALLAPTAAAMAATACSGSSPEITQSILATPPPEAASDAGANPAPSTGPPRSDRRFCETLFPKPWLCADFDGAALKEGWHPADGRLGGGTLEADELTFASGPRSARFTVPALVDAKTRASAHVLSELPGVLGELDFACDLRIDADPTSGVVQIFSLEHGTDAGYVGIFRWEAGWALTTFERVAGKLEPVDAFFAGPPPVGDWTKLEVAVRSGIGTAAGTITATLGSSTVTLAEPAAFHGPLAQKPTLSVGVVVARGPLAGFAGNVDNVRYTVGR